MSALAGWSQWWSNRSLRIKGLVLIAVPLVILLGALASGYLMGAESRRAQQGVQRTLQIQHDIQEVHTLLAEAATGVRGYLLTGRSNFLERYRIAETELPRTLRRLRGQIRDPRQRALLDQVAALAARKSEGLSELVGLGNTTPAATLVPILVSNKVVLDELRGHIDAMLAREDVLRRESERFADQVYTRTMIATGVASAAGVLGALVVVLLFSTGIGRRVRDLADNAERLARGAPLAPIAPATDELGQLAARMAHASTLLAARSADAEQAYREAERASKAKTEFLSRTSHELRTPLNAILGFAQLLERELTTPAEREHVGHILKGGRHLLALINEVLDIARIETGHLDLDPVPVEVDSLLREALALIAPMAGERGVTLAAPAPASGVHVLADRKRLLQVMLNLLSNAVKYNHPNGTVSLRVEADAGRARIGVSDNGPGIDPSLQARLFTPFDRLGAERRPGEGTGLGLAVSLQMVRAMGGDIGMESTLGQGSTFRVELPLSAAPGHALAPRPASMAAAPSQRACTVLYIEDQSSNLALVEILLARRPNITLLSASTGSEGLELAQRHAPDLVLLDLHLPDVSGLALLAQLRASAGLCQMPVVMVSADALPATIAGALAAGAADYLTKPLDVSLFFATLDRLLP
ncbi:CHASE3 domain-containing protein [Massilia antarctica]|uniref:histidine kinase n=1 Tax=Massilia antarctica TaxID=2765360 RepID=A0AA49A7M9_9BURK|nr:ATP-binding protein [Massilia antarctica]QPI49593.1 CHASE3 domain-containing protein [Massilia antarctica]